MASTSLNSLNLEKRLLTVSNTQESIQSLSLWCLHHKSHFKKIIEIWLKVLKKAKVSHRLALFYLANDVIQNSRRKGCPQFSEAWQPMIKQAVPFVSDEKIRIQIERILSIWEDRNVYDAAFIGEMHKVIASNQPKQTEQIAAEAKLLADFKPQKLADKIRKYRKMEADIDAKQKHFTGLKMDVCNTETLKQLKDKAHGTKFSKDFEDATSKLDEFVTAMQRSVKDRAAVIEMLEQSEAFYEVQKKEAKIVTNAYKNFGNRVKNLQIKLKDYLPNLSSPVPSPNADAPSPVDSSDGDTAATPSSAAETNTGTATIKGHEMTKAEVTKDATKDNTEAIDMEMSDEDSNHATHASKDNDAMAATSDQVSSPSGSAPSPEGSPVGLNLSPVAATAAVSTTTTTTTATITVQSLHSKSPVSASPANSIGKLSSSNARASPIVHTKAVSTASSIFASLSKGHISSTATSNGSANAASGGLGQSSRSNASSLDIRLSNLLQNVPNFTSSFFGGRVPLDNMAGTTAQTTTTTTTGVDKSSPSAGAADSKAEEGGTPLKDEESGTGSATPLQDESRPGGKAGTPTGGGQAPMTEMEANERNAWKLVVPPTAVSTPAVVPASMHSSTGYGPSDNGGGESAFYSAPSWATENEPTGTSNNIVDILQKLAAGTAMTTALPPAPPSWIAVSPATSDAPPLPPTRPWYDGFSPPPQPPLTGYSDPLAASYPYDPEIQFPELDDIHLPDEMPPPDFDAAAAPPQNSCNSRNLITIAVQSGQEPTSMLGGKRKLPPLMGCNPTNNRLKGANDVNHMHGNGNMAELASKNPPGMTSDDDDELYSRIETLDSRRDQQQQPSSPDMSVPWNVSGGPRPHYPPPPQSSPSSSSSGAGWHQIFPISVATPPPRQQMTDQRRDQQQQPHYGFRFPQRGGAPRRDWQRDGQGGGGGGHNAKRPPPPMMQMRPNRWPHSQRRPY